MEMPPATQPAASTAPLTAIAYRPVTPAERVDWVVDGTIGIRSLTVVGPMGAAFLTATNSPGEWGRTWSGVGKRYLQREADVAISSAIEAGAGALWGEDPRYVASGRKGIWPRARYAIKTAVLAQRSDGHLAPAWGRIAGNTVNNVIENAWLPPSATTPGQTLLRAALGFLTRMGGNAWDEYWPDAKKLIARKFRRP
ncbi:MAG TPA: hypothetical protein VEU08_08545 [Vicinamibacterales bacterium]|nr:hypothetical protein [Vicinamibacterales bacterium]